MKPKVEFFCLKASVIAVQSAVLALAGTIRWLAPTTRSKLSSLNSVGAEFPAYRQNSYKFGRITAVWRRKKAGTAALQFRK